MLLVSVNKEARFLKDRGRCVRSLRRQKKREGIKWSSGRVNRLGECNMIAASNKKSNVALV